MDRNSSTERTPLTSLSESFERYLQDKGKGRGGDGGNYLFKARIPPFTAGVKPTTPSRSTVGCSLNTPRRQTFIRIGCVEISTTK